MLIDKVLDVAISALLWLVNLLPGMDVDLSVLSGLASYVGGMGYYINLSAAATVLGLVLAAEAAIAVISLVVWLYDKVPLT